MKNGNRSSNMYSNSKSNPTTNIIILFIFVVGVFFVVLKVNEHYKTEKREHILECANSYQRNSCERGLFDDNLALQQCLSSFNCEVHDNKNVQCSFRLNNGYSAGYAVTDLDYDEDNDLLKAYLFSVTYSGQTVPQKNDMSDIYKCS